MALVMKMDGIVYEITCSAAPLQIEGTIDGVPFYFRSRWTSWRIGIGGDTVMNPDWRREDDYGTEEFDASWMPEKEGLAIIERCAKEWRESKAKT
jgi:hypothetical protein